MILMCATMYILFTCECDGTNELKQTKTYRGKGVAAIYAHAHMRTHDEND